MEDDVELTPEQEEEIRQATRIAVEGLGGTGEEARAEGQAAMVGADQRFIPLPEPEGLEAEKPEETEARHARMRETAGLPAEAPSSPVEAPEAPEAYTPPPAGQEATAAPEAPSGQADGLEGPPPSGEAVRQALASVEDDGAKRARAMGQQAAKGRGGNAIGPNQQMADRRRRAAEDRAAADQDSSNATRAWIGNIFHAIGGSDRRITPNTGSVAALQRSRAGEREQAAWDQEQQTAERQRMAEAETRDPQSQVSERARAMVRAQRDILAPRTPGLSEALSDEVLAGMSASDIRESGTFEQLMHTAERVNRGETTLAGIGRRGEESRLTGADRADDASGLAAERHEYTLEENAARDAAALERSRVAAESRRRRGGGGGGGGGGGASRDALVGEYVRHQVEAAQRLDPNVDVAEVEAEARSTAEVLPTRQLQGIIGTDVNAGTRASWSPRLRPATSPGEALAYDWEPDPNRRVSLDGAAIRRAGELAGNSAVIQSSSEEMAQISEEMSTPEALADRTGAYTTELAERGRALILNLQGRVRGVEGWGAPQEHEMRQLEALIPHLGTVRGMTSASNIYRGLARSYDQIVRTQMRAQYGLFPRGTFSDQAAGAAPAQGQSPARRGGRAAAPAAAAAGPTYSWTVSNAEGRSVQRTGDMARYQADERRAADGGGSITPPEESQ